MGPASRLTREVSRRSHAQKLVQARSLKDALTLQAEFARSQLAALQAQAKELASLARPAKA